LLESCTGIRRHNRYWSKSTISCSHRAKHVFLDAALSWDLLKDGGLLIFDDYELELKAPADLRPKVPIDTFLLAFGEELEVVHKGYQVAVRKTKGSENEKSALEQLLRSYHDVRLDRRELAKVIEKDSVLRGLEKRISLTAKSVSE
jgi:hypothetical protein